MAHTPLKRLPKEGDRLLYGGEEVIVVGILSNGNFASTIAVQDAKKRVFEVRKEELKKI